jgi:hypothetical protein
MKTQINYTKKEQASIEVMPATINIRFLSIEFISKNGEKRRAIPGTKGDVYVIIENEQIRFTTDLEFV